MINLTISKIYLIIHPLFAQINREEYKERPLNRQENKVTGNELHEYFQIISAAKKDPHAIVLFAPTMTDAPTKRLLWRQERLLKYARKELGHQLFELPTEIGYDKLNHPLEAMVHLTLEKIASIKGLGKTIHLGATGQYGGECVREAMERVRIALTRKGKKVVELKLTRPKTRSEWYLIQLQAANRKLTHYRRLKKTKALHQQKTNKIR